MILNKVKVKILYLAVSRSSAAIKRFLANYRYENVQLTSTGHKWMAFKSTVAASFLTKMTIIIILRHYKVSGSCKIINITLQGTLFEKCKRPILFSSNIELSASVGVEWPEEPYRGNGGVCSWNNGNQDGHFHDESWRALHWASKRQFHSPCGRQANHFVAFQILMAKSIALWYYTYVFMCIVCLKICRRFR